MAPPSLGLCFWEFSTCQLQALSMQPYCAGLNVWHWLYKIVGALGMVMVWFVSMVFVSMVFVSTVFVSMVFVSMVDVNLTSNNNNSHVARLMPLISWLSFNASCGRVYRISYGSFNRFQFLSFSFRAFLNFFVLSFPFRSVERWPVISILIVSLSLLFQLLWESLCESCFSCPALHFRLSFRSVNRGPLVSFSLS